MYRTRLSPPVFTIPTGRTRVGTKRRPEAYAAKCHAPAVALGGSQAKASAPGVKAGELIQMHTPGQDEAMRLLRDKDHHLEFMLAKPHGKGAFGTVSYAQTQAGTPFLAKTLYTQAGTEQLAAQVSVTKMPKVLRELEVHRDVPSAVESVAAIATADRVVHLMALFDGDLAQAAAATAQQRFTPAEQHTLALEAFAQVSATLSDFHKRLYVHGDVKLDNILWSQKGVLKLADYGVTRSLDATSLTLSGKRGTPYAMAPEIFSGEPYACQADMWSLGVTLGEMFVADPYLTSGPGNPFRRIQQPPQWALPMMLLQVLDDEGKLDPSRLQQGRSDMHMFFQAWWANSPHTCRFAIEELFDLNPNHRATADRARSVAQDLIDQRPGHAEAARALLRKLPVADGTRSARFAQLTQAWQAWQRVQNLVAKQAPWGTLATARVRAAA